MKNLLQDYSHGLHILTKSPEFTAVAVLTLALGISVNTTVLTWIDGILMNPLHGVADSNRLVAFETTLQNGEYSNTSYRDHLDYLDNAGQISGLALWTQASFSVGGEDDPERVSGEFISGNYFSVLGVRPSLGNLFVAEEHDHVLGAHPVAVISDRLWRRRFGEDPGVIGKMARVNRRDLTIIGVASPEFHGGTTGLAFDIWVPLTMAFDLKASDRSMLTSRTWRGFFAIARLRPGATLAQARAGVKAVASSLASEYPNTNRGVGATLLPLSESPTGAQSLQFCLRLRERLSSMPGVAAVGYADTVPLGFSGDAGNDIEVEGYVPGLSEKMNFSRTLVAPGYFALIRIPLLEGRDFMETDEESSAPVMIVNETFAHRFFQAANPIGRKVRVSGGKVFTVVGVVGDIKNRTLAEVTQPYIYMPIRQKLQEGANINFLLRTVNNPDTIIATVRREASAIDPAATSVVAIPLSEYITASLYPQKVASRFLIVLGLLSLFLAAVGLYSIVSYAVSRRTHELGIRMALGAQPSDVVLMMLRQGMLLTLAGLAAGIAGALAATRLVASMLIAVSPADPATFIAAGLFLGVVAMIATYVPTRRAAKVDPMVALRVE